MHFWHIKQSPLVTGTPSCGSSTADGQFLVQPLQPRRQDVLSLCREKKGSTGSNENTAPIGQKKRQKKRSFMHMPATRRISSISPTVFPCRETFPMRNRENTSQGLLPCNCVSCPVKQSTRIMPRTIYFITGTIRQSFSGSCNGFFLHFLQMVRQAACSASPKLPNAQANPQKKRPNSIVNRHSPQSVRTKGVSANGSVWPICTAI